MRAKAAPRSSFNEVPLVPATPKNKESSDAGAVLVAGQLKPSDQLLESFPTQVSDAAKAQPLLIAAIAIATAPAAAMRPRDLQDEKRLAFPDRLIRDDMLSSDLVRLNS